MSAADGMDEDTGIALEPLTPAAFAPFGDVVTAPLVAGRDQRLDTTQRFDWTTALENGRPGARPNLVVIRARALALPLRVQLLERHPHSTQVFAPLRVSRWVVAAAPHAPGGGPDLSGLRAFLAGPADAISFRAGVWHHPLVVLDETAEMLMLVWEDGSPGDCEVRPLERAIRVG